MRITKVKKQYPYREDEVTVGDPPWKTGEWENQVVKRVRRLEEQAGKSTDLLLQVFDLNRSIKFERRYMKAYVRTYPEDTVNLFILGHSRYGVLGRQRLGNATGAEKILNRITPGDMIHREFIYDDDFTDDSTTATVDTSGHTVTF